MDERGDLERLREQVQDLQAAVLRLAEENTRLREEAGGYLSELLAQNPPAAEIAPAAELARARWIFQRLGRVGRQ